MAFIFIKTTTMIIRPHDYLLSFKCIVGYGEFETILSDEDEKITNIEFDKILKKQECATTVSDEICNELYKRCVKIIELQQHAFRFLKLSALNGNLFAISQTFEQCKITKKIMSKTDEFKKLLLLDTGVTNNLIGCIYSHEQNYILAVKYYLKAIEQQNNMAIMNLGFYYQTVNIDHVLMKKYYDMNDSEFVNFVLGVYYSCVEIDYERMIYHYTKKHYDFSLYELIYIHAEKAEHNKKLLLHNEKSYANKELLGKYFKQLFDNKCGNGIFNYRLKEMTTLFDDCEFYQLLKSLHDPCEKIISVIKNFEKDVDFMKLIYKINVSTEINLVRQCMICMETKLNILINCGHLVCVDCYNKVTKCPMCQEPNNIRKRTHGLLN